MDTFGALQTAVQSAMGGRDDIPQFVYDLTTADINRDLRLIEMQTETTLSATAESVTLPTDFLEVVTLYVDATPRKMLFPVTEGAQAIRHDSSGQPAYYAIHDGELTLMPVPDGTYSLKLRYYARLTDFSESGDTNDVLVNYPSVFFYGALTHAAVWASDQERLGAYSAAYSGAMEAARKADAKNRRGSAPMVRRSIVAP